MPRPGRVPAAGVAVERGAEGPGGALGIGGTLTPQLGVSMIVTRSSISAVSTTAEPFPVAIRRCPAIQAVPSGTVSTPFPSLACRSGLESFGMPQAHPRNVLNDTGSTH